MKQAAIPILVLTVIVGLAVLTSWPSGTLEADHYRRFQDGNSLFKLLSSRIKNGDSLEVIEHVLGPSIPLTDGASDVRALMQADAQQYPERYPNGVYDSDVLTTYPIENSKVLLQLRNGFLVNHDPRMFEQYYPAQDIGGVYDRNQIPVEVESTIGGQPGLSLSTH